MRRDGIRVPDEFCDGPLPVIATEAVDTCAVCRTTGFAPIAHHQYLATELNPDRHKHACFNKTDLTELLGYVSGITSIARSVRHVFLRSGRQPAGAARDDGYAPRDLAILLGVQTMLIGGLSLVFGWWGWPVLWLAPVYLALPLEECRVKTPSG